MTEQSSMDLDGPEQLQDLQNKNMELRKMVKTLEMENRTMAIALEKAKAEYEAFRSDSLQVRGDGGIVSRKRLYGGDSENPKNEHVLGVELLNSIAKPALVALILGVMI